MAARQRALAEVKGTLPWEYTLRQALFGFAKPKKRQRVGSAAEVGDDV